MKKPHQIKLSLEQWVIKRKLRKQMLHVLKCGYRVKFNQMTTDKVNGMDWKERLLAIYIVDMAHGDFTVFHRTVKPIARNLEFVELDWWEVLNGNGELYKN